MSDLHEILRWWEKESQKDLHPAIQELGKRLIESQINYQKQMKAQEEKLFQREHKLFSRFERCHKRLKTLEERVEIQVEMEVEDQKIVFSGEVDRALKKYQTVFLETVGTMLQSFQGTLRKQNPPKGKDTPPKAK